MHERADCDPRRMVLVPALEGFRRCVSHVGGRAYFASVHGSAGGMYVSGNRERTVQGFSIHALPLEVRDSRAKQILDL